VVVPTRRLGTFAVTGYLVDFGQQGLTDENGAEIGSTYPRNVAVTASYASTITRSFAVGLTYRLYQERKDCSGVGCDLVEDEAALSATTSMVDVGAQYDFGTRAPLVLGASVRHLGLRLQVKDSDQKDPLPTQAIVGARYEVTAVARRIKDARFTVTGDVARGISAGGSDPSFHVGAEGSFRERVLLRGGMVAAQGRGQRPERGLRLPSQAVGARRRAAAERRLGGRGRAADLRGAPLQLLIVRRSSLPCMGRRCCCSRTRRRPGRSARCPPAPRSRGSAADRVDARGSVAASRPRRHRAHAPRAVVDAARLGRAAGERAGGDAADARRGLPGARAVHLAAVSRGAQRCAPGAVRVPAHRTRGGAQAVPRTLPRRRLGLLRAAREDAVRVERALRRDPGRTAGSGDGRQHLQRQHLEPGARALFRVA
jgi:hypothetical protein